MRRGLPVASAEAGATVKEINTYCQADGCNEPTKEGRRFCPRDTKREERRRKGKSAPAPGAPVVEPLPPMERAIEAMNLLVDTPAEDDQLYDERRRKLESVLLELSRRARPEAIRRGLARARAAGKRLGRPPKLVADAELEEMVQRFGMAPVAQFLGVDPRTLAGALERSKNSSFLRPPTGARLQKTTIRARTGA